MADKPVSKKRLRQKLGIAGEKLVCDELLVREMEHDFGTPAHACLAIDRKNGKFTSFNTYGEKGDVHIGRNFDAEGMTHDLPAEGDEKWKKWSKKGYALVGEQDSEQFGFTDVADFDVVEVRKAAAPAPTKPTKQPAPTP